MEYLTNSLAYINQIGKSSKAWEFEIIIFLLFIIFIFLYIHSKKIRQITNTVVAMPGVKTNTELIAKVTEHDQKIFDLEIFINATEENFKKTNQKLKTIYKAETVRYNPYQDMGVGGNQSFSTAFINDEGNGIILTSLYARDRTRLLLKEIKRYECTQELTPEEKDVLKKFKR